jgi:actin, other eukaryote
VGEEALSKKIPLEFSNPIEKGIIQNFEFMDEIWNNIFYNDLRVDPPDYPVMMSEEIGNTSQNRQKTASIMFENYEVHHFFLEQSSVLSLFSSGKTTGMMLDIGHTKSTASCIYDGKILPRAEMSYLGGRYVSDYLEKLLENKYTFYPKEKDFIHEIKEFNCLASLNILNETSNSQEIELPDGSILILDDEKFLAPEILFDSKIFGLERSIQEITVQSIRNQDIDLWDQFFENINLSGGGSMLKNLPQRLGHELRSYYQKKINFFDNDDIYSSWTGASLLSCLSSFQKEWITKDQYEEIGGNVIDRMCINNVKFNYKVVPSKNFNVELLLLVPKLLLTDLKISFD